VLSHFETWTGSGTATARIDANRAGFTELTLNGNTVGAANYTVTAGSTIITLHENYLKTLANGTYTFRAGFTDGFAEINLTVNVTVNASTTTPKSPKTGDPGLLIRQRTVPCLNLQVLFHMI